MERMIGSLIRDYARLPELRFFSCAFSTTIPVYILAESMLA